MYKYIMKKALIQDIVFDEFDKVDYINIFNANENKYLKVYSEEIGSISINTFRKNSLVDYVEINEEEASLKKAIPIKRKIIPLIVFKLIKKKNLYLILHFSSYNRYDVSSEDE